MKRRRVIVGLIVLALVGFVAGVILWPRGPRPCRATFGLLHKGMTYDEVCATVGGPPGDYTDGTRSAGFDDIVNWLPVSLGDCLFWTGEDGELVAWFDNDNRLGWMGVWAVQPSTPPSFWSRLLTRLGL
jgi:hypothetical protein